MDELARRWLTNFLSIWMQAPFRYLVAITLILASAELLSWLKVALAMWTFVWGSKDNPE